MLIPDQGRAAEAAEAAEAARAAVWAKFRQCFPSADVYRFKAVAGITKDGKLKANVLCTAEDGEEHLVFDEPDGLFLDRSTWPE